MNTLTIIGLILSVGVVVEFMVFAPSILKNIMADDQVKIISDKDAVLAKAA